MRLTVHPSSEVATDVDGCMCARPILIGLGHPLRRHFVRPRLGPAYSQKLHNPHGGGDYTITAAEFDALFGHSVAVTDAAASCFAVEMIAAYPDAQVIINIRGDLDKWHASAVKNLCHKTDDQWGLGNCGKWIHREHSAMIRGLVPSQQLLEWRVEDGREPLCKFLGKEVPHGQAFPRTNHAAGY